MFPVFQIGSFSVQSSGLILLAGIWIALTISEKRAPHFGLDPEVISNLIFYSLIAAIVGARLSYTLRFPAAFIDHPASLISLNPGLLDPWGAALAALLASLIYGQKKNLEIWKTLDSLTPAFAVMGIAFAFSQLASGLAYGLPTDLPWALELWGMSRHPSQIYMILASAFIYYFIDIKLGKAKLGQGNLFLAFFALSAFMHIFLDAFRGDSATTLLGFRSSQVFAWFVLAASLFFLSRKKGEIRK